jgi:hypothetical protein
MAACAVVLSLATIHCGGETRMCSPDVCVNTADATVPALPTPDGGPDARPDAHSEGGASAHDGGLEADAPLSPCRLDAGPEAGACTCLPAPVNHRPTPTACPRGVPPATSGDGGAGSYCNTSSQCAYASADGGVDGRCGMHRGFAPGQCTYDTCFADTDCPAGELCNCDPDFGDTCVPGNCTVDSDCACGFCSPTGDPTSCLPDFGPPTTGYYCHTPQDDCTNDDQCQGGICGWQPMVGKWACIYAMCAG